MRHKRTRNVNTLVKFALNRPNFFTHVGHSRYYKRIVIDVSKDYRNVYDASTDLWRPLTEEETDRLIEIGFERFNTELKAASLVDSYRDSRRLFHIASVKKNLKEQEFFFKKAIRSIKKLRDLLKS
jgi:hypothetical protein